VRISPLGGCPKCKGFLMLEKDMHGLYQQCLQCGYVHELETNAWTDERQAEEEMNSEARQYAAVNSSNSEI